MNMDGDELGFEGEDRRHLEAHLPSQSTTEEIARLRQEIRAIHAIQDRTRRRGGWLLASALVVVVVSIGAAVGSWITNAAVGRVQDVQAQQQIGDLENRCRAAIVAAYSDLSEARQDLIASEVVALRHGEDSTAVEGRLAELVRYRKHLPPRADAYRRGVTVRAVNSDGSLAAPAHFPACSPSSSPER